MIQMLSKLQVADNSGAKLVQCIKVLGGAGKMSAELGDEIVVSIKSAIPRSKVKKGDVHRALIVRTLKERNREDGSTVKFSSNAVVLLDSSGNLLGTRVFGPVPRELRAKNHMKVISLAPEVL